MDMPEASRQTCDLCGRPVAQLIRVLRNRGEEPLLLCSPCLGWEDAFFNLLDEIQKGRVSQAAGQQEARRLLDILAKRCDDARVRYFKELLVAYDVAL